MPRLAMALMQDVLSQVEKLCLGRKCAEWGVVLAVFCCLLMTVESIQYHAAKMPYHAAYDSNFSTIPSSSFLSSSYEGEGEEEGEYVGMKGREGRELDETGCVTLRAFYKQCFGQCHVRLQEDWIEDKRIDSAEDKFIEEVREAMKKARRSGYLGEKARAGVEADTQDMGWFFDRLVARLLVLSP